MPYNSVTISQSERAYYCSHIIIIFILHLSAIDSCNVNPCKNGGTCTAVVNTFKCICPVGYKGDRCQGEHVLANDCPFIRIFLSLDKSPFSPFGNHQLAVSSKPLPV